MRRLFNNIVSVGYTFLRMAVLKLFHGSRLNTSMIERFSPNVVFEMNQGAKVTLGKKVRVHSGTKIKVRKNAELTIGKNAKINYNCIIACQDKISIGAGTEFGPSVYLYDHDHDYRAGLKENKFLSSPIEIGENCWIGANTVILRGTKLGANCVVGAGCVIKGEYPAGSVIVQKRTTDVYQVKKENQRNEI